jgi:hypothetical protein
VKILSKNSLVKANPRPILLLPNKGRINTEKRKT